MASDLNLSFASGVLSVQGVSFGLALGDYSLVEAFVSSVVSTGLIDLAEVSLLEAAALDVLQAGGSIVLATITFEAIGAGDAGFALPQAELYDADGDETAPAPLTSPPLTVVPEPSSGALLGAALLAFAGSRRVRRR